MRAIAPTAKEEDDQIALFRWADITVARFPELSLLVHIGNGGSRHLLEAVKLKRMGVRAGFPDILLPVRRGPFSGLAIELKRESLRPKTKKGRGGLSSDQAWWLTELWKQGYSTHVCWGFDEARKAIESYLGGER